MLWEVGGISVRLIHIGNNREKLCAAIGVDLKGVMITLYFLRGLFCIGELI